MAVFEVLVGLVAVFTALYYYMTSTADFWTKRGIPHIQPTPFVGSSLDYVLLRVPRGVTGQRFYKYAKERGLPYVGVFLGRRPALILTDLDMIKTVMVKDFQFVMDRGNFFDREKEPLSANLFNLGGAEWKTLRAKLSPTFTTGKMKAMFYLVRECAHGLADFLDAEVAKGGDVEMNEILAKYSTDVIGSCAFGIEANSLKEPDAEFRAMGRKVFTISPARGALRIIAETVPALRRIIPVPLIKSDVSEFFTRTFNENVQFREQNKVVRHDFLDLLIQLKHHGGAAPDETVVPAPATPVATAPVKGASGIDENLLPAQAFIFFLAGFETSSGATSACLLYLAHYPEVQDKLRAEVDRVLAKHQGVITHEALQEMTFMEQTLEETMRLFPALGLLPRVVTRDYQLPGSKAVVPAGTQVHIPVYAIHRDPEYYPDPDRFDPDRFSEDNKKSIPQFAYLPFGEGPRICIGMRFAWMQMKSSLAVILKSYKVSPNEHTVFPIQLQCLSFLSIIEGGARLTLTKR